MKTRTLIIVLVVLAAVGALIWYVNNKKKKTVIPGLAPPPGAKAIEDLKPGESVNEQNKDGNDGVVDAPPGFDIFKI